MTDDRNRQKPLLDSADESRGDLREPEFQMAGVADDENGADFYTVLEQEISRLRRWVKGRLPASARGAGSDEEDLVQDAVTGLLAKRSEVPDLPAQSLRAYLRRSVQNRLVEIRRAMRQERDAQAGSHPIGKAHYETALSELSVVERTIVVARFELGMSYADIAKATDRADVEEVVALCRGAVTRLATLMYRSQAVSEAGTLASDFVRQGEPPTSATNGLEHFRMAAEVWLSSIDDLWLRRTLQLLFESSRGWDRLAACGMYLRLRRPLSGRDASAAVRRLIQTQSEAHSMSPRDWIRGLSQSELASISSIAIEQARLLRSRCEDELAYDELSRRWVEVAYLRDDIEGVRMLLAEAGSEGDLDAALETVDEAGLALRFSMPVGLDDGDERLLRVSLCDPTAWWGSLAYSVQAF